MATQINPFLQSPFQALIDEQPKPLPGSEPVREVEAPDLSAEPAPQPAPASKPRAAANPKSLLPPPELRPMFEGVAAHFGVPVNVLMAVAQQESSYQADAKNPTSDARGIGGYRESTAKNLRINQDDPNEAVPAIAQQLRERLDKGYSLEDAVKEHFAGPDRKKWGEKTAAYGQEVLGKAGAIGKELYGDEAAPSVPAQPGTPAAGPEQNQFSAGRMDRATYEKEFRALNPKASDDAVKMALDAYDKQAATKTKAAGSRVQDRFDALKSPDALFEQRLNARLQAGNEGVAQALPGHERQDFSATTTKHRPGLVEQAKGDFGRGIDNLKALGYGAAGLAADGTGHDEQATKLLDQYVAIQNDIAKNNPATIGTYRNVKNLGDAGRYAIEAVMENLPMLLPSLATGGVGAQAAKAGAQRLVGGMIESQVAKGVAREVAEKQAAQYVTRRVLLGSAAGAAPATIGMESGSIMGDIYQDTGKKAAGTALAFGIPAGLLDTLEPVMALRKIAGPAVDEVAGGIIKRLGVEAGKQFIAEAGTEGLQTVLEEAAKAKVANKNLMTPGLLDAVIDSALKGGIGGAGMGVASGGVGEVRAAMAPQVDPAAQAAEAARTAALDRWQNNGLSPNVAPSAPAGRVEPMLGEAPAAPEAPAFTADDEGFTGQILGDDGQVHTIDSRTGVTMADEPAPPAGPLEAALHEAAAQHAADPAPAPVMPEPEPAPPDYTAMPLDELKAKLKEVAGSEQNTPEQRLAVRKERQTIEKEMAQRAKQAQADSKPAEAPLKAGPFEDMPEANAMMLRYAESTGTPHEVVGTKGHFVIQPIGGKPYGIDPAGVGPGPDGHGRGSEPAAGVGRPDGKAGGAAGRGTDGTGRAGQPRTVDGLGADAGADRTGADGAGFAAPAVSADHKTNPYHAYAFPDAARAEAFMDKKAVDREKFEAVQTGPVRWQVKPRAAQTPITVESKEQTADVPQRQEVPEEAPVARGEESPQQADNGATQVADAGVEPVPAKPKRKPSTRELTNAKQEEVVKAAAEKLAARKAEKEAAQQVAEPEKPKTRDTRGTGVRFHGTSRPLPESGPNNEYAMSGDNRNIYGQGFYTTDAADISEGYMRKGRGGSPTLYEIKERGEPKLYDMEQPMTPEVRKMAERVMGDEFPKQDIDGKPINTLRELFDEYRDESKNFGLTRDDVQEVFDAIRYNLGQDGYHGYRHIGGLKTDKAPHDVRIYWTPEDHLSVEKSDLSKYQGEEHPRPAVVEQAPAPTEAATTPAKPKRKKAAPKAEKTAEGSDGVRYSVNGDVTKADGSPLTDEDKAKALDTDRWMDRGVKLGKAQKLYRGTSDRTGHNTANFGRGLYYTTDKKEAAMYGTVSELSREVLPKNALRFSDEGKFREWESFVAREIYGYRRMAEFEAAHGIPDEFVRELDPAVDGIQIGTGPGAFFVTFPTIQDSLNVGEDRHSVAEHPMAADALASVDPLIQSLADAGVVVLHEDASTLPGGKAPLGVQALTEKDGTIHMVAPELNPNARAVLLHEAFHSGGQSLVGSKVWGELMTRLGSLYRQGEATSGAARAFWDKARARVETAKVKGAVAPGMEHEEFGAYAIEEYESAPTTVRKWVDDLVGAVKAWALRRFGRQLGQVTPAQLSALAKAALLDVANSRTQQVQGKASPAYSSSAEKTVEVDGVRRPIENAKGQLIAEDMHKQMAFWRWFKDSAVKDEQGRPLVVYHGTADDFAVFDKSKRGSVSETSDSKLGFFFSDSVERANRAAEDAGYPGGENVMPIYLKLDNPLVHNAKQGMPSETARIIRAAIKKGHDGVIFSQGERGGADYVVFEPEQIKSAAGNDGSFDASNPDIRYSVAAPAQAGQRTLTPDEQGLLRRVQGQVQDNLNRVKQVQERIAKLTGTPVAGGADYYGAETNRPGRIAARKEDGRNKLFEPMLRRLADAGYTPDQLEELLHAQHAEERNEAVAKINPEFADGGSGMKTAEAHRIMARYQTEPKLLAIADEARQIARETLDMKLAYGLITDTQHDSLSIAYDNYVPLKGDGEYGPKVKRAMGHGDREEHILENIARDFEQAIVVGEKNLARQSLLQMVLQYPDDSLWTARVPPKGRYVAGTVFEISPVGTRNVEASFTSQAQVAAWLEAKGAQAAGYEVNTSGGERVVEFTKPLQDNEVMVYIKGSPVRLQIQDEALARQLRPLRMEQMGVLLTETRKVIRWMSIAYTGYNPYFIPRNAIRDLMTGSINMAGNHGVGTMAKAWTKYPAAWGAMFKYAATGKASATSKMGQYLQEYRSQGGKTGASYMSDLEEQGKTLERMFDDAKGAIAYAKEGHVVKASGIAARKAVMGLAHVVEVLNQAFENALRLALFAQLREEGAKPGAAAQAAKNVTVNFDRKGASTNVLGAAYLFLNPAIQGTANMTKTLAKGEHKFQAWGLIAGVIGAGVFAALHGMDDDKDRWLGEKWDTRTKNFRMRIGTSTITIPVSQEYAPFYAAGVALGEMKRGQSGAHAAVNLLSSFLDAYYPMQGAFQPDSDNPAADFMLAHVPTVLKLPVQVAMNRNSFGSKIVPETDNTKNRPDNLKMARRTKNSVFDKAAQGIAQAGEAIGYGDKYENDLSKVSPETLRLVWQTYTGGLGRFITDTGSLAGMMLNDPSQVEKTDIPFATDFYKPDTLTPIRSRYYDMARKAEKTINQFETANKMADEKEKRRIFDDPEKKPLLQLSRMITATNKIEGAYADQAVAINADKSLNAAEKRAELKKIEKVQQDIYQRAINVFSGKNPNGTPKEKVPTQN